MSGHQRYFAVENPDGSLLPLFVAIRNGDDFAPRHGSPGQRAGDRAAPGRRRVLPHRGHAPPLPDRLDSLARVTYIEGMGSLLDKTQRLQGLVGWLCGRVGDIPAADIDHAARAAELAKCDLTTTMIGDTKLAKLQGRVGAEYARRSGEKEEVALAIAEQYRPHSASDEPPVTAPGRLVALADKLDHLAACFRLGLRPTGSADPHALRRAAAGIVRIVLASRWRIQMPELIARGAAAGCPRWTTRRRSRCRWPPTRSRSSSSRAWSPS